MGEYSYHLKIAQTCPDVVAKFGLIKDASDLKEFQLGGIGELPTGTTVIAAILYYLPFKINGRQAFISFALAKNSSINTLIGLPFMTATGAVMNFDSNSLVLNKFGYAIPFSFQQVRSDKVPPMVSRDNAVFTAQTQSEESAVDPPRGNALVPRPLPPPDPNTRFVRSGSNA